MDSVQRKRHSSHASSYLPSKRLKASNLASPARPSPLLKAFHSRHPRAEKWFEDTNKNASRNVQFLDNDPPFYVDGHASSEGDSVCAVHSDRSLPKYYQFGKPRAPTRSLLAQMESSESNIEDFRSVIDDLTIQNKKLKKKLKQYEKLHCSHLQKEKLFEVRIHGLSSHHKRELEKTLQKFASSIEESSPERYTAKYIHTRPTKAPKMPLATFQTPAVAGVSSAESSTDLHRPSSASTFNSKPVDSGYASMSGGTGTSYFQSNHTVKLDRMAPALEKQQSVKSYLHDIPESLVPKDSGVISERAKSKLVVKRLEQIFTGKGAASHRNTQMHQQQEVSQSAAQSDRNHLQAQGRDRQIMKEGVREAHILPTDTELRVDTISEINSATQQSRQGSNDGGASTRGGEIVGDGSPDQRPTRPLDLDLHRAQISADNIEYIRHLGLELPRIDLGIDADADDGWVYLNLLSSMAQLHTLSVTPDFIRHAIMDNSFKLELSDDGTKVRWPGGTEGTTLSSDSEDLSDIVKTRSTNTSIAASRNTATNTTRKLRSDRQKSQTDLPTPTYESSIDPDLGAIRGPVFIKQANDDADFHYKPLFFHGRPSDNESDSELATESIASSDVMENATGMNSGINSGSHGLRETEIKLRKHNAVNGPMIFYHKARFCTDLSGDPSGVPIDEDTYVSYTQDPVGYPPEAASDSSDEVPKEIVDYAEMDLDSTNATGSALDLDDLKSCISEYTSPGTSAMPTPLPMEVSGLGGIQPKDNFMVKVEVKHSGKQSGHGARSLLSRNIVKRMTNASSHEYVLKGVLQHNVPRSQPIEMPINGEIMTATKTNMKPSSLPSPSFACLPFSSSSSEGSEDDEMQEVLNTNGPHEMSFEGPTTSQPTANFRGSSSGEYKESSFASTSANSDDDDDDDSIDLLAHARVTDPEMVAAREREFELNTAQPLGSAAATAGESSSGLMRSTKKTSDVDSMSVDGDGASEMYDSH